MNKQILNKNKEIVIPFTGKIRKVGNSYTVTIPSDYIKHGMIWEEDEHQFYVKVK